MDNWLGFQSENENKRMPIKKLPVILRYKSYERGKCKCGGNVLRFTYFWCCKILRILKFCIIRLSYKIKVSGYNKLNIYKYLELMLFYNILILFGIYKVSSSALKKIFNILLIKRQNESVCLNNSIHCLNLDSCCVRNLKMRPSGQHMEIGRHQDMSEFNVFITSFPLNYLYLVILRQCGCILHYLWYPTILCMQQLVERIKMASDRKVESRKLVFNAFFLFLYL